MNLEKQFQKLFNGQVVNENRVKGSVQICDEFAVGFAEWFEQNTVKRGFLNKYYISKTNEIYSNQNSYTITQLLEIYKQGL